MKTKKERHVNWVLRGSQQNKYPVLKILNWIHDWHFRNKNIKKLKRKIKQRDIGKISLKTTNKNVTSNLKQLGLKKKINFNSRTFVVFCNRKTEKLTEGFHIEERPTSPNRHSSILRVKNLLKFSQKLQMSLQDNG